MTTTSPGTVLITGPTGGLGRAATLAMGNRLITGPTGGLGRAATLAMGNRPASGRPDLPARRTGG